MDLGAFGGGKAKTQRYVIGVIDPSSKWVHCEVFQGKSPTPAQARQVVVNALLKLGNQLHRAWKHAPGLARKHLKGLLLTDAVLRLLRTD